MGKKNRKKRSIFHHQHQVGAEPGELMIPADAPAPIVQVLQYDTNRVFEWEWNNAEPLGKLQHPDMINWVNLEGLGDAALLQRLGRLFKLHPLSLEDAVHTHQRPKVDYYQDYVFLVARMPYQTDTEIGTEQVSIFLGKSFVLTLQEGKPGDCLDSLRKRLQQDAGPIRTAGPDYLVYSLLDTLIDSYFPLLELYGEQLEQLEEKVIESPYSQNMRDIYAIRRALLVIRRAVWPLREVIGSLLRETGNAFFSEHTRLYLHDCYDHIVQLLDLLETYRDLAANLMELYLSSTSYRMNEIMKFLTMVSTIFIPLTFVVGVYGMNFKGEASPWNMPELTWYYGYPAVMLLMFLIAAGIVGFFYYKGWLGRPINLRKDRDIVSAEDEQPTAQRLP